MILVSKKLAENADLFVNDAGTAHRAHGSTAGVTEHLKPSRPAFFAEGTRLLAGSC